MNRIFAIFAAFALSICPLIAFANTPEPTKKRATLWNQSRGDASQGVLCNLPEPEFPQYETQVADDFVIPQGEEWRINGAVVDWVVLISRHPGAKLANIVIFKDDRGKPGEIVAEFKERLYLSNIFLIENTISFPDAVVLGPGRYWFMFQAIMPKAAADQTIGGFIWEMSEIQTGYPAMFRNPGGGYNSRCTDWGDLFECGFRFPDLIFDLEGTKNPGDPSACDNPLPLPDNRFTALILDLFDSDGDQLLCPEEVNQIREINCAGRNLTSLTGLDLLPNLTRLICDNNQLQNLPDLSRFHNLTQLSCSGNNLTELPPLPLSLEQLNASNNSLSTVPSPTSLPVLKSIDLTHNDLDDEACAEINIYQNRGLEFVRFNPQADNRFINCGNAPLLQLRNPTQQLSFGAVENRLTLSGTLFSPTPPVDAVWRLGSGAAGNLFCTPTDVAGEWRWFAFDVDLRRDINNLTITVTNRDNLEACLDIEIIRAEQGEFQLPEITEVDFPERIVENVLNQFTITTSPGDHGILRYEWDFNDDGPHQILEEGDTRISTSKAFIQPGIYQIRVLAFDHLGFYGEIKRQIEVTPANTPPVVIRPLSISDSEMTVGQTRRFLVQAQDNDGDRLFYNWTLGDGNYFITTEPFLDYAFNRSDSYEVTVLINDGNSNPVPSHLDVTVQPAGDPQIGLEPSLRSLCKSFNNIHPPITFRIFNAGEGTLDYQTRLTMVDEPDTNWVQISGDLSGSVTAGEAGNTITLSFENSDGLNINRVGYRAEVEVFQGNLSRTFMLSMEVNHISPSLRVTSPSTGKFDIEWDHFPTEDIAFYRLSATPVNTNNPVAQFDTVQAHGSLSGLAENRTFLVSVEAFDNQGVSLGLIQSHHRTQDSGFGFASHFPHVAQNDTFWTGVAVINPGLTQAEMTIRAYDAAGNLMGESPTDFLQARGKLLAQPNDLFPNLDPVRIKRLAMTANQPLVPLELFGDHPGTVMSGVPTGDNAFFSASAFVSSFQEDGGFNAFGLANPSYQNDVLIKITGYNTYGMTLMQAQKRLSPGQQSAFQLKDLFEVQDPLFQSVSRISFSAVSPYYGFKLSGQADAMNGGPLLSTGALNSVIPMLEAGNTLFIANGEIVTNHINFSIRNLSGQIVYQQTLELGPNQMVQLTVPTAGAAYIHGAYPVIAEGEIRRAITTSTGDNEQTEIISEQVAGQGIFGDSLTAPHAPSSADFTTQVAIQNAAATATTIRIDGFSSEGEAVGQKLNITLQPFGGFQEHMEHIFPNQHEQIKYVRITGQAGDQLSALILFFTKPGKGARMGAFIPSPSP